MGIRVIVQERRRLFRECLSVVLQRSGDVEPVAVAATARELIDLCDALEPDAIVIEAHAEEWDTAAVARELHHAWPSMRIIGIYAWLDQRRSLELRRAGVSALVSRSQGWEAVLLPLRDPSSTDSVIDISAEVINVDQPTLTTRELNVLRLVGGGRTTKEVSALLCISPKTVENHKQRIFHKLEVQNQAHAIAVAMRRGMLDALVGYEVGVG